MIFKTLNLNSNNLYNIADKKTKDMVNVYIEDWKEQGLLKGYFEILAKNIYNRTRVKNSEILELLIYSEYIEEQNKLDKYEQQIMYKDANYYYQQGQEEVNKTLKKKNPISILDMALFLYLLEQPNYTGLNLRQCIEATIQYNIQQIYRQVLLNIQQQKDLEIENKEFERILNQQQNTKLYVYNDKISGFMDMQMIGLNNLAKAEGIKKIARKDAMIEFWAVTDENSTDMCQSMNGMKFYINKENSFDRYWGETKKELKLVRIRVLGLVLGVNLPPISHHWHWCRSTIRYLPLVEKEEKTEYNGLASYSKNTLQNHTKPKILEVIDYSNKKEVIECLEKYERMIQKDNIENAIVITRDGEVYQCFGNNNSVWPDYDLKDKLKEAYVTHNHPKQETEYSFSESDINLFNTYNLKILRGKDYKYTYELNRNKNDIDKIDIFNMSIEDGIHALNINRAEKYKIGYRRWKND